KFRYAIYPDQRSAAWGDGEILSYQAPTASLAGKKLTLSWVAPNEATQKAIEALIPTPPPGQELDRLTDNAWSSTNRPPCTPLLHNQPPNSPAGRCSRRWRSWLATAWACRR
ncbi:MAG: hypothetical protein LBI48_03605, partial [Burkholderiaceae bacterium]|nr:hypothetical protein [Burkholderiaceae bacterium]